jgi:hypothetical protein
VDLAALESGDVRDGLAQLWRQAPVPVPPATGADEAAALLARHLGYIP